MSHQIRAETAGGSSATVARGDAVSSLVLRELQHRMANTLTVLHASLRREFATITDPGLKEAVRRHEVQIMSVAELHRFFANNAGNCEIPAEAYFQALGAVLSRSVLAPLGLHCETFVERGYLSAEKCEWLGMAIAELVMNAAKHAFPDGSRGRVRIEMLARDACWCCTISDNGAGMQNISRGSGSKIIDCLIEALDGQFAIRTGPDGTAISIIFAG